jgi:hypothetical protein
MAEQWSLVLSRRSEVPEGSPAVRARRADEL